MNDNNWGDVKLNGRVKELRKFLKLSQEAFGKGLGVTGAGISKIESGDRNLTPQMTLLICQQFGVNEDWLKTGNGEMFNHTSIDNIKLDEALKIFQSLRPEFQDYALEQIKNLIALQEKIQEP